MKKSVNRAPKESGPAKLLSSGNPQVEKGDGNSYVQAYINAMPGWKRKIGKTLDQIADKTVPEIQKAVRWNTPFFGTKEHDWFFGFYCYKKYVQVFFLNGEKLKPMPPVKSKQKNVRYLNIFENDELDTSQIEKWLKQGCKLPGEKVF
jgi:hypothetical protein